MLPLLLVGSGGFIGAVLRYLLGGWVHQVFDIAEFPLGTLVVNLLGCFLIGLLNGLAETGQLLSPEARLFTFAGILGGFTTFSSFGYETFAPFQEGEGLIALLNIGLQVVLGLTAVGCGYALPRLLGG